MPSRSWVSALEAGASSAKNGPSSRSARPRPPGDRRHRQLRWRPITSAISRVGTPSSPIAWNTEPAGAFPAPGGRGARRRGVHRRPPVGARRRYRRRRPCCGRCRSGPGRSRGRLRRAPRRRPHDRRCARRGRRTLIAASSANPWDAADLSRPVLLGRDASGPEQRGARGDDERPARALERRAERLDGAQVGPRRRSPSARSRGCRRCG